MDDIDDINGLIKLQKFLVIGEWFVARLEVYKWNKSWKPMKNCGNFLEEKKKRKIT